MYASLEVIKIIYSFSISQTSNKPGAPYRISRNKKARLRIRIKSLINYGHFDLLYLPLLELVIVLCLLMVLLQGVENDDGESDEGGGLQDEKIFS